MRHIKDAGEAMAGDMHEAAMRLGTAEMMLASASYAVRKHAGRMVPTPAPPGEAWAPAHIERRGLGQVGAAR
jgi:hypothetical protein